MTHQPHSGGRPRRRVLIAAAAIAIGASVLAPGPVTAGNAEVEHARALLEQLVATRRLISEEETTWKLGEEMLRERIELVQREIEDYRAKIEEAETGAAEAGTKVDELLDENAALEEASAALETMIVTLEAKTRGLVGRLPEPLLDRIHPLVQRLPAADATSTFSLGKRFETVVGILDQAGRFNREIGVFNEVRRFPDGTSVEVMTMYVGLGAAYYAAPTGTVAGVGTPGPEGWTWTPDPRSADAIRRAIAIFNSEQAAEFVPLPIRIEKP